MAPMESGASLSKALYLITKRPSEGKQGNDRAFISESVTPAQILLHHKFVSA